MKNNDIFEEKVNSMFKQFAKDVLFELKNPETHLWFDKSVGLCFNFALWMGNNNLPNNERFILNNELKISFGWECHPFNISFVNYMDECGNNTVYKNKKRLKWLKDHAK